MKILLIGGNGFLGNHIKQKLLRYDVFSPTHSQIDWRTKEGFDLLTDYNPDVIVHLLAIYGGLPFCLNNRVKMGIENLEINANVFRYIADVKPSRLITIGSGCEYPGYKQGILKEKALGDGKLHESVEHYGYTKLMQLMICKSLLQEYNIGFEHLVLANMYGEGDVFDEYRSHVVGGIIYKFFKSIKENSPVKLLGTGRAIRDLVYVGDVAEMISRLISRRESTNEPLNASTGKGTCIKDLVKIISDELNYHDIEWGDESQDGALVKYLSVERTKEVLGWIPNTSLKEGIKKTISWYKNNENWNNRSR